MNWLKRKVIQWVREDWENQTKKHSEKGLVVHSEGINRPDEEPILNFRIYSATNGQILEFRRYDRKSDSNHTVMYIIEKDRDIGEYVNKCLSLEMLK